MIRIKRGITTRNRKKKIYRMEKGFQSSSKNRFRLANQKKIKANTSSYYSRKKRKIFLENCGLIE